MDSNRIKCSGVPYRQGWVEIAPNVHQGRVNLEAWSIVPEVDMSLSGLDITSVQDSAVSGNVEVEMSIAQAKQLLVVLQVAIEAAEHASA